MKKVSYIIPIHNRSGHLDILLNNLRYQTYKDFEVIVSDDNSTEDFSEILKKHDSDLDIKYIRQEFDGEHMFRLASCRNIGASIAGGDILVFCDSDVISNPDSIYRYVENFKKYGENIVISAIIRRLRVYYDELEIDRIGKIPYLMSIDHDGDYRP